MKELAVRLKKGADLKASIEEICLKNEVGCAVILSGVGCLYEAQIRLAGATEVLEIKEDLEIVSLTGTIAAGKSHIHISLADPANWSWACWNNTRQAGFSMKKPATMK